MLRFSFLFSSRFCTYVLESHVTSKHQGTVIMRPYPRFGVSRSPLQLHATSMWLLDTRHVTGASMKLLWALLLRFPHSPWSLLWSCCAGGCPSPGKQSPCSSALRIPKGPRVFILLSHCPDLGWGEGPDTQLFFIHSFFSEALNSIKTSYFFFDSSLLFSSLCRMLSLSGMG